MLPWHLYLFEMNPFIPFRSRLALSMNRSTGWMVVPIELLDTFLCPCYRSFAGDDFVVHSNFKAKPGYCLANPNVLAVETTWDRKKLPLQARVLLRAQVSQTQPRPILYKQFSKQEITMINTEKMIQYVLVTKERLFKRHLNLQTHRDCSQNCRLQFFTTAT